MPLLSRRLGTSAAGLPRPRAQNRRRAPGWSARTKGRRVLPDRCEICVGPVTRMGCLQDGLRGESQLLAIKSVLDGFNALAFASALGWGVPCSAGAVLVVQGGLTSSAHALNGVLTPAMTAERFATGGVMMLGLGAPLLELKPTRVANFLPGLVIAPVLVTLVGALQR